MQRFIQAAFYSLLFTIYGGSIYYLVAVVTTLSSGGNLVDTFVNTILGCFFCWLIAAIILYEILGAFEEFNKSGRKPETKDDANNADGTDT